MPATRNGTPPGRRTLAINLQASADLCRLAIAHFRARRGGRAHRQRRQPRRLSRRFARALALCRVQGGHDRHDQDHRPRLCGAKTSSPSRSAPASPLTGMVEDYLASRGGDKLLADIPLGRVATAGRDRRDDPLAGHRRPAVGDRRGDRRQRRELCSLASAALALAAQQITIPLGKRAAPGRAAARADRAGRAAMGRGLRRFDRLGQARAAGADPRQHLSRRHLRHFAPSCHRQRRPCADRRRDRERRRPDRRQYPRARLPARGRQIPPPQPRASRPCRRDRAAAATDRRDAGRLGARGAQCSNSGTAQRRRPAGRNAQAVPRRHASAASSSDGDDVRLGDLDADRHGHARPYARRAELALGKLRRRGVPDDGLCRQPVARSAATIIDSPPIRPISPPIAPSIAKVAATPLRDPAHAAPFGQRDEGADDGQAAVVRPAGLPELCRHADHGASTSGWRRKQRPK